MKTRSVVVVLATLAVVASASGQTKTIIRDVDIVDVEAGLILADRDVFVRGDLIARIDAGGRTPDGWAEAAVIDGDGLYLIPGLFDAHVHFSAGGGTYGPLLVAHGVTCARDTGADTDMILALRERSRTATDPMPELVCTGAIVDGVPPIWPFSEACDTPDEGRAAVRKLHGAGVDQIKVYSMLEPDVYAAVVEEAHVVGLKVTGHIPASVSLDRALEVGQDCNEHLMGFDKMIARLIGADELLEGVGLFRSFAAWSQLPEVDRDALQRELHRVRDAGMVQCPTVVVMKGTGRLSDPRRLEDPRLEFVPATVRAFWESGRYGRMNTAELWPQMQTLVGEMHRAGITLMVGTDLANPYVFAGSSVHEEMQLFQEAGMPAVDVLRAATIVPARFCGVDDRLGAVEPGKTASMVLLRANPLDDIASAAKIDGVFVRGRHYDRAALDGLLDQARSMVSAAEPVDDPDAVDMSMPGEIVRRGRYVVRFGEFDAGTEDFAISRDDDGWHIKANSQPQGGVLQPALITYHVGPAFEFRSAEHRPLTSEPTVTTYARRGRELRAEATTGDGPLPPQTMPVPETPLFGGPAYVLEMVTLRQAALEPGRTLEARSISFGFGGWQFSEIPYTLRRHDDVAIDRPDGTKVTARRYTYTMTIPSGTIEGETWADEDGVVLKTVLVMPFGTLRAELQ